MNKACVINIEFSCKLRIERWPTWFHHSIMHRWVQVMQVWKRSDKKKGTSDTQATRMEAKIRMQGSIDLGKAMDCGSKRGVVHYRLRPPWPHQIPSQLGIVVYRSNTVSRPSPFTAFSTERYVCRVRCNLLIKNNKVFLSTNASFIILFCCRINFQFISLLLK